MSTDHWFEEEIKEMLCLIVAAKKTSDIERLFEIILTSREINDMARRLKVIEMLDRGCSYGEIRTTLRVSNTLIARLSNHLGYGFRRSAEKTKKEKAVESIAKTLKNYAKAGKVSYKGMPGIIPISKR